MSSCYSEERCGYKIYVYMDSLPFSALTRNRPELFAFHSFLNSKFATWIETTLFFVFVIVRLSHVT
jgi:hypothetical protein